MIALWMVTTSILKLEEDLPYWSNESRRFTWTWTPDEEYDLADHIASQNDAEYRVELIRLGYFEPEELEDLAQAALAAAVAMKAGSAFLNYLDELVPASQEIKVVLP